MESADRLAEAVSVHRNQGSMWSDLHLISALTERKAGPPVAEVIRSGWRADTNAASVTPGSTSHA
jgi:hypothetical protein